MQTTAAVESQVLAPQVVESHQVVSGQLRDEAVLPAAPVADDLLAQDLLVEDVSIDGMCGVY